MLIEDGVGRVHGDLVLGRITDQTLRIGKSDVRKRRFVTLVVSYDLNTVVLPQENRSDGEEEASTSLDRRWVSGEMDDWVRWVGGVGRWVGSVEDWVRWVSGMREREKKKKKKREGKRKKEENEMRV